MGPKQDVAISTRQDRVRIVGGRGERSGGVPVHFSFPFSLLQEWVSSTGLHSWFCPDDSYPAKQPGHIIWRHLKAERENSRLPMSRVR